MFCITLQDVILCLDSAEQNTKCQTAVEGAAVTISCQYENTDISPELFWYQPKENGFPKYMLNRQAVQG